MLKSQCVAHQVILFENPLGRKKISKSASAAKFVSLALVAPSTISSTLLIIGALCSAPPAGLEWLSGLDINHTKTRTERTKSVEFWHATCARWQFLLKNMGILYVLSTCFEVFAFGKKSI